MEMEPSKYVPVPCLEMMTIKPFRFLLTSQVPVLMMTVFSETEKVKSELKVAVTTLSANVGFAPTQQGQYLSVHVHAPIRLV